MLGSACYFLCKVRLASNCNRAVSSSLSFWRNYAANELKSGSEEISSKPKFVPCGGASFLQHVDYDGPIINSGRCSCYYHIIQKALEIEASNAMEAGAYAMDIQDGVSAATEEVFAYFKRTARMVHTPKEIAQVATAAAGGDIELGNFVAKGMQKVGKHGAYIIDKNEKANNEVEFVNALEVSKWGHHLHHSTTIFKSYKTCLLEHPFILVIVDKMLNKNVIQAVQQAMRLASCTQSRSLLIVAEDVEMGLEGSLTLDGSSPQEKLCVVKPPKDLFVSKFTWREMMEDLAILTGGQVVTRESDMNFIFPMLGSCEKVRISDVMMLIYNVAGGQKDIEKRCTQLRSTIKLTTSLSDLETRLQYLSQAARFKVGKTYNLDRVDYVACDTQMAMKVGILPGGGVAYLNASKELDKLQTSNSDFQLGVQLLQNALKLGVRLLQIALKMPVYCIAAAAGFDGLVAVEKLLERDNPDLGYNMATGEFIDMIESGFIDRVDYLTSELEVGTVNYIYLDDSLFDL